MDFIADVFFNEKQGVKIEVNITQYFVPERDPWYNKGIAIGEERGEEATKREFTALLLISTDFTVERISRLVQRPVDYVNTVKTELTQIRILFRVQKFYYKNRKNDGRYL